MKLPKSRFTFCPTRRKHTDHKVAEAKKKTRGSAHPLSWGNRLRPKLRGRIGMGNNGKYSKPPGGRMFNRKQSKKVDLRFECTVCKKQHIAGKSWRAKKVEFKEVKA